MNDHHRRLKGIARVIGWENEQIRIEARKRARRSLLVGHDPRPYFTLRDPVGENRGTWANFEIESML